MAILNNNPLVGASGNQGGYNINNSLRFRRSATASLTRTPSIAGNRRTFTWSAWVKRGVLDSHQFLLSAATSTTFCAVDLLSNTMRVNFGNGTYLLVTTQVFRDPSAWYHIVLAVDTTQATDTNRVRLFVNGNQVTAFSTAVYPIQNYDTAYNNTVAQRIGVNDASDSFDGYMAEVNFIDGQAKVASDFGETDTTTGVWKPKAYSGTYGTNGFYLKFSDIATTSGSNAGLGKDFSGNSNYWTTNNISVTSGATYDAMTDVPTNTSATVANYAVCNPLALGTSQTSLTQGNLYAIPTSGASNWGTVFSTIAIPTSGKYYIEATAVVYTGSGNNSSLGVVDSATFIPTNTAILYQYTTGEGFDGILCHLFSDYVAPIDDGVQGTNVTGITGTSVNLMLALDVDNGKVYAGYNGTWLNSGNPAGGTGQVATRTFSSTDVVAGHTSYNGSNDQAQYFNFGQRPFTYTPPTGFVALNTYNLPTSTIVKGNTVMDATLYTGNGSTQSITNAGAFRPDFVWIKRRDGAGQDHVLQDSNRGFGGTTKLASSSTAAENTTGGATGSEWGSVTAANSNGFSITASTSGDQVNKNTWTYVGWQWQAGQGSTSSNTSGSITSTVSVNTTAGFSIVTYTGTGANATVGHGLGVAPSMIIIKRRNGATDWATYHASVGNTKALFLNRTLAADTSASYWNNTSPTSTLFTVGTGADVNPSSGTMVAYVWAEIAGFSRFGSYTGNGSTDGTFVYTGFRPKYILIKRTNLTEDWYIYDTSRITYNLGNIFIYADLSDAEGTGSTGIDILSNGFKQRQTGGGNNASGSTYIYMAFAENPFKNALAR